MKEVNEAYEILSDPDKKAKYDQFGHAGIDPTYGGGGGFGGFSDFGDMGDIFGSDIFSSFFGGSSFRSNRANPNAPRRGQDLQTNITIDFMDACKGKDVELKIKRSVQCPDCGGTGAGAGSTVNTCPDGGLN